MPFFVMRLLVLSILAGQKSMQIPQPLQRSSTIMILGVSTVEVIGFARSPTGMDL